MTESTTCPYCGLSPDDLLAHVASCDALGVLFAQALAGCQPGDVVDLDALLARIEETARH